MPDAIQVRSTFGLAENDLSPVVNGDWVNKLVMLGRLAARWTQTHREKQLVIVLSVPVRDFAAVLIGTGWMTASPSPSIRPVREVLADLTPRAPVRVVTSNKVFTAHFGGLDVARDRARLGTDWQVSGLRAVVPLESLQETLSQAVIEPGAISRLTGMDKNWADRLCAPPNDLALVGTLAKLDEELLAWLDWNGEREPIANILLPQTRRSATWSTRTYPASQLEIEIPLKGVRAVVLDGAPATRFLSAIDSPVAICVLDRSVADESAQEYVLNYRNTQGEPISLEHQMSWRAPAGIEAVAFEVSL